MHHFCCDQFHAATTSIKKNNPVFCRCRNALHRPARPCRRTADIRRAAQSTQRGCAGKNGGFGLNMRATVVDRDGEVKAVVFSGEDRGDQWPGLFDSDKKQLINFEKMKKYIILSSLSCLFFFFQSNIGYTAILQITSGFKHNLSLKNGELWVWGSNGSGQLGDGSTSNSTSPVQIGSDSNWNAIAAGLAHSLALKNGELWAWGANSSGQLGDGSTSNSTSPVRIGSDSDWKAIAAGSSHSLALKNGELWAWGDNNSGQLGDGSTSDSTSPVRIGSDSDWEVIAAGSSHSLALKNGELWAWGDNSKVSSETARPPTAHLRSGSAQTATGRLSRRDLLTVWP
ncbi:MAG: hypothetical protein D3906_03280 [Candidatus Electrothrix sp. AUS1_2]|nr:hypothetical protein [Candidatus Electrothrix sp. AUS1_2]